MRGLPYNAALPCEHFPISHLAILRKKIKGTKGRSKRKGEIGWWWCIRLFVTEINAWKRKPWSNEKVSFPRALLSPGHLKPSEGVGYMWCIVPTRFHGNVLGFCALQIMCPIACLIYWQKNIFSCRGAWLRALKWANTFQQDVLMTVGRDDTELGGFGAVLREALSAMSHPRGMIGPPCSPIHSRASAANGGPSPALHCAPAPPSGHSTHPRPLLAEAGSLGPLPLQQLDFMVSVHWDVFLWLAEI